ncbi:helix-turn-helix domain-containing protein [Hirsutella rhossiliensis]|uniref:Helix-turn-helix domain-containing protein n=1 Tax=Hirsutella rhossiliensis TaxID=111463 RepID=A0A9P8SD21_9HYPO|nr:helix-turn-helix domain-containing protein [Hirsutella rhossiliensis]KAH0958263.1 helix-turn-helix domain-containing protein [Hirsutella rhossiliensis]
MQYTLYDASIRVAQDSLNTLTAILKKGEAHPNAAKLPEARIYDDMLPLTFQIHIVTDLAQKMQARLTGKEPQKMENDLKTFKDMYARIDKVQEMLSKTDKDAINNYTTEKVPLGMGPGKEVQVSGLGYTNGYALPNLFFHVTTAYNIMRKEGVPLGKLDYLKPYLAPHVPGFEFPA